MAPVEEEMGRAAVSDAEPGTDCPPPDPNPNPQARPPPVPGLGPRPFILDGALLERRKAEWEAARLLQRFKPYPYLPYPFRAPIANLHLGFNDDLGRGVHPSPPRDTLPTEGRAAWRPQQFRPNPNRGLESHGLAQPPPRPNLGRGFRPSTPRYPVPAQMRAVWRPRQFQPNPNPDLESRGSEQPGPRPDLGGGLRPSLPEVPPGIGVGKLAEWRKTLRLWELTLKHESREMIDEVESRRRELRHLAEQTLKGHRENSNAREVTWNNLATCLNGIMKATEVVMWSYLMVCQNPFPQRVLRTAPYVDPECTNTRSIDPTHMSRTFSEHAELPSEPSDFMIHQFSRFEKHMILCHQWLTNLHRLLMVGASQTSAHLLPVFRDGHNFLIQVGDRVDALERQSRQLANNLESVQSQDFGDEHQKSDPDGFLFEEIRRSMPNVIEDQSAAEDVHPSFFSTPMPSYMGTISSSSSSSSSSVSAAPTSRSWASMFKSSESSS